MKSSSSVSKMRKIVLMAGFPFPSSMEWIVLIATPLFSLNSSCLRLRLFLFSRMIFPKIFRSMRRFIG